MASSERPRGREQVTLLPENTEDCEKDQLWLNSQELQMVREALETNQGRLSLRWALEPMTGTASKDQFLKERKGAKMPDPSDPSDEEEEEEDENDDNLGRASPTMSNLSGNGHMMSSRMLKSIMKPTSPQKDDKSSKPKKSSKKPKKPKKPSKGKGAKPEKGSKNDLGEDGELEGTGSESDNDNADKDADQSSKGYGPPGQVLKSMNPKDPLAPANKGKKHDKRTKDDSGDENPKGKKAKKGSKRYSPGEDIRESDEESNSPPAS